MHGLKQLVYDDQPFFPSNQSEKTNQELYILWKQNKSDNIFLILYTQLWMKLEEIYMENVIDYYKKDCYEKKLFFELVEYSYAAEPPVQFRLSHLSRRSEPL